MSLVFRTQRSFTFQDKLNVLPTFNDVLPLPDPSATSATSSWVYNSDDKLSSGLYPLGLEVHPEAESTRRSPVRHSSFSAPRYAKVLQRPQRALSFATTRDPFSLHGSRITSRPLPVSTPRLVSNLIGPPRRSKSFLFEHTTHGASTLGRKCSIFSQSRDLTPSVIQVGSFKSIVSERKLISTLSDFPGESRNLKDSVNHKSMTLPLEDSRRSNSTRQYTFSCKGDRTVPSQVPPPKPQRMKGPAPLPPPKPLALSEEQERNTSLSENENSATETREKLNLEILQPRDETLFEDEDSDKTIDSERCCSCSETYVEFEEIEETDSALSYDSHLHRDSFTEKPLDSHFTSQIGEDTTQTRDSCEQDHPPLHKLATSCEILKPPRKSLLEKGEVKEAQLHQNPETKWEDFKQVLTAVLERKQNLNNNRTECETSKETFTCESQPTDFRSREERLKSSKYETVHKEIIRESETLLNQLPNSEVQKNKIVLRVPSFRTTGCQTEVYRPVRRRASCSQTNFVPPSHPTSTDADATHWKRSSTTAQEMQKVSNMGSSSSSGYSSPDGGSKQTSPVHSGPPSPASCYGSGIEDCSEGSNGPNVTIIEISRISPKTVRLRNRPDAASVKNRIPEMIPESPFQSTQCSGSLGLGMNRENLLAGATTSDWIHVSEEDRIPRIIHAIPKPRQPNHSKQAEHSCRFEALHKYENTEHGTHPQRTNSLSLPRFMNTQRTKISRTSSFMGLTERENAKIASSDSTEVYLASLELLASHYRQQALTNVKLQQRLLEQQKLHLDL